MKNIFFVVFVIGASLTVSGIFRLLIFEFIKGNQFATSWPQKLMVPQPLTSLWETLSLPHFWQLILLLLQTTTMELIPGQKPTI
jgi:hypothetical protein